MLSKGIVQTSFPMPSLFTAIIMSGRPNALEKLCSGSHRLDSTVIGIISNQAMVIVKSSHQKSVSTRAPLSQGNLIFDIIRMMYATLAQTQPIMLAIEMVDPSRTGLWHRVSVTFLAAVRCPVSMTRSSMGMFLRTQLLADCTRCRSAGLYARCSGCIAAARGKVKVRGRYACRSNCGEEACSLRRTGQYIPCSPSTTRTTYCTLWHCL